MSELKLDVDQAGELKAAFRRADYTNEEIKRLCEGTILAEVRRVLHNHARIVPVEHVITCTCGSFLSYLGSGWSGEEHSNCGTMRAEKRSDGQLYINGRKVERYPSFNQQGAKSPRVMSSAKELSGHPVLCPCVLDYLSHHTELIPEDWKSGVTFFWETRVLGGRLHVADLYWCNGPWGVEQRLAHPRLELQQPWASLASE